MESPTGLFHQSRSICHQSMTLRAREFVSVTFLTMRPCKILHTPRVKHFLAKKQRTSVQSPTQLFPLGIFLPINAKTLDRDAISYD